MSDTLLSNDKLQFISDQIMYEEFCKNNGDNSQKREKMIKFIIISINTALTSKQRYCIEQCYFGKRTQAEIARELGVNVSVISRHLSRALARIKKNVVYYYELVEK